MLTLNFISTNDVSHIAGSLDGEKFSIEYTKDLWDKLTKLKTDMNSTNTMEDYDKLAAKVKVLITAEVKDNIVAVCPDFYKNEKTGKYHVQAEGKLSKKPVPQPLIDIILKSIDKGIDPLPVVKSWVRFLRNPNFTSNKAELFAKYITATIVDSEEVTKLVKEGYTKEKATALATYSDVGISEEGLIVGKKFALLLTEGWEMDTEKNIPVRVPLYGKEADTVDKITGEITKGKDILPAFNEELYFEPSMMHQRGDKFFCGSSEGHVIRVGEVHELDKWDMVNTDDSVCCVRGLHVGGYQYVKSYGGENKALLDCFIDPADIGAIVDINSGDGALRVKSYFIYDYNKGRNKGLYHSSHYAAIKDAEWEEFKRKAIEESNKKLAKVSEDLDNLGA